MKTDNRSNQQIILDFRKLLTEGCPQSVREETKPWRTELWNAFKEIEMRLDWQKRVERERRDGR